MHKKLRIALGGQDVTTECVGLDELSERLYWGVEQRAFMVEMTGNVTFIGGAFNTIRASYLASYANLINATITRPNGELIQVIIFPTDIKFNLSKRSATCQLVFDPIIQKIDNNRQIEVTLNPDVVTSKNGVDISARAVTQNISMTSPLSIDPTSPTPRLGWRIWDAFNYIIGFITDDEVRFVSDYFSTSNPQMGYTVLVTGHEMLYADSPPTDQPRIFPTISFGDFFDDMVSLCNLGMAIEYQDGIPYLRIEPMGYWNSSGLIHSIPNCKEVTSELDRSMFYASIRMGSIGATTDYYYLRRVSFYAHFEDQFYFTGRTNVNNELNLMTKTIVFDTNAVCSSLPLLNGGANNADYKEDVLLVQCDSTNSATITPEPFSATDYYYNDIFRNVNTAQRWSGWIPFSFQQQVASNLPLVRAGQVDTVLLDGLATAPAQQPTYPSETFPNFDPYSLWSTGTIDIAPFVAPTAPVSTSLSYFTAAATDYYQFYAYQLINSSGNIGAYYRTQIMVARWNGTHYVELADGDNVIHSSVDPPWGPPPTWDFSDGIYISYVGAIEGSVGIYLQTGDIAYVRITFVEGALVYNGVVEINQYGGIFMAQEDGVALLERVKVKVPISDSNWGNIKADPYRMFRVGYFDGNILSRARDIQRNLTTGDTDIDTAARRADNT